MKTTYIAAAILALSTFGAANAQTSNNVSGELYQVTVTAPKSTLTREQVRQETIKALRAGQIHSGEDYQGQAYEASQSKVSREAVRADARAAARAHVQNGGELYQ